MKRYSLEWDRRSDLMEMCEDSDGDWVRFDDHEAAVEEALAKYDKRVERALRAEGSAAYDAGAQDGFRDGRDFGRKEP